MTQDVSDVLTNEHAEIMEYYREKSDFFNNKTAQCIYDLYEICPDFNFDKYYSENREEYLQSLFPLPEDVCTQCVAQIFNNNFYFRKILILKS